MKEYLVKNKPIVIFFTAGIIVMLLIVSKPSVKPASKKYIAPLVKIDKVESEDIQVRIFSQGSVKSSKEIILSSEIAGKINWVSSKLQSGSQFNKNDILLTFDKRDFELALIVAESNLSQAMLGYERELAEFQLANKEWDQIGEGTGSSLTLREPQFFYLLPKLKKQKILF